MSNHVVPRRRRRAPVLLAAVLLTALVTPSSIFAWGAKGHRIVGSAAVAALPDSMPAFFRAASEQLSFLNPEPDRWKARVERDLDPALDGAFNADHFLDTELAPPSVLAAALAAPHRYAYSDTLRAAGVDAVDLGFLPFAILELTQRLRQEFRMWRTAPDSATRAWIEARVINDAGILGHYVADASNPAHTTVHYTGWTGANPNGYATDRAFHGRFETAYVQAHIELSDVQPRVSTTARVLPNVRTAVIAYIASGNAEVERLYALDKADPWGIDTRSAANKAFAADRLAAGASMLRDLWWTAWVTSTGPAPENR
jgi:hypothetical protein